MLALFLSVATDAAEAGLDQDCVMRLAETGDDSMSLAEIRQACRGDGAAAADAAPSPPPELSSGEAGQAVESGAAGLVEQRLEADREAAERPFSIIAHRPNYFLAAAYNAEGWSADSYRQESGEDSYTNRDVESQFQVSLKVPLAVGQLGDRLDV